MNAFGSANIDSGTGGDQSRMPPSRKGSRWYPDRFASTRTVDRSADNGIERRCPPLSLAICDSKLAWVAKDSQFRRARWCKLAKRSSLDGERYNGYP